MKNMKSIMRIAALTALGLVAAAGIFSADTSDMMMFFVQKAVGFGAAYALGRLYMRWRKTDKWLQEYEEIMMRK